MKFSVENLGRIKEAQFDIKPLTVFIGKANTNKTWTAYALYGLIRSLTRSRLGPTPLVAICPQLNDAIESVAERTAARLADIIATQGPDVNQQSVLTVTRDEVFAAAHPIGETLRWWLDDEDIATVLGVDASVVDKASATLEFRTDEYISAGKLHSIALVWTKQYSTIVGLTESGKPVQSSGFAGGSEEVLNQIRMGVQWLVASIFDESMAFPSERKGLSVNLGVNEFARREFALQAPLSLPSSDYVRFLFPFHRTNVRVAVQPSKIVSILENRVMNGKADFFGPAEQRVFSFKGEGPIVQMNASASFVRSLAGLDLYLRTTPNHDVIVIDEPEMNAHPEAQLKLVEFFAMLANQGRHIIITTHSPYFLDHLNNLMRGHSLSPDKRTQLAENLKLKDSDAFISANQVSAYQFHENGTTEDLFRDGEIDLTTFATESDYMANLGRQICEALAPVETAEASKKHEH